MTAWKPPAATKGDTSLIRTSLSHARRREGDCPTQNAVSARPRLWARSYVKRVYAPLQNFVLRPFMDALDRIEHLGEDPARAISELRRTDGTFGNPKTPPSHPGHVAWAVEAVMRYLGVRDADEAERRMRGLPALHPVEVEWVWRSVSDNPDARGVRTYEQTAWGRRYASADGRVRELRLFSLATAKEDRSHAEKGAAAGVLLNAPSDSPGGTVERVRVVDVGCGDGTTRTVLDWDRAQALRAYQEFTAPALADAVAATGRIPGSNCVKCRALAGCDDLASVPGLLGAERPARHWWPRRSLSASDLRLYLDCPAQYHLTRVLWLRSGTPESSAIRRGRAVDAWLNDRHRAVPHAPCGADGPPDPDHWAAGGIELTGAEARAGARMIAQHAKTCALRYLGPTDRPRVQQQVACHDPDLDVVVIAVPDLLYPENGGWIWRETKTAARRRGTSSLLQTYPQLALGVLLLANGVLGGESARSRVELEILHPDGAVLEEIDPSLPEVVDDAHAAVSGLVARWHADVHLPAVPGKACGSCEAAPWCAPGQAHLAAATSDEADR
ncbi:PD-(D/E)XK nuclease family protein [Streptomonospora nanhaiensis]|uniref:PD-(D/E)XK nuclease family protein n=1 Tax=Streptomonospora nanhaiensis TaxID=1323731 RepID=UPI001C99D81E|nr:PD-(D/E)XK nuclease family protein [Streptomonospora nanhaiensis]MBX9386929.1 PD-(D/E)XK nuclease family protein [Streptomonospora nanhaiensis]